MDNICNVPKLVDGLPRYKVDNKTAKLRGTKPDEWCLQNDPSKECYFDSKGPKM